MHIGITQTGPTESEVLHTTLPNQPLTLLPIHKTPECHDNWVFFRLVYCIRRFIFIHYQQQSQLEPMYLQLLPLTMVPTLFSVPVLQESSTRWQFCTTRSPLICSN
jgi:hypothetical protein